ncbi:MAG: lysine biosynthesis protein LysW [Phycisphaerae bacterium]|jgi:alpha-aminoadipate carrier protein LysW
MTACVICGGTVPVPADAIPGELIECAECGGELEIVAVDPLELAEAPTEEEDWGQ